jgi:antitoxin (DNA-binding transcriptional repressor) of toxin-antitoxin stability system
MTWAVNVEQPGTDLASLVDRVVAGEDVVLVTFSTL